MRIKEIILKICLVLICSVMILIIIFNTIYFAQTHKDIKDITQYAQEYLNKFPERFTLGDSKNYTLGKGYQDYYINRENINNTTINEETKIEFILNKSDDYMFPVYDGNKNVGLITVKNYNGTLFAGSWEEGFFDKNYKNILDGLTDAERKDYKIIYDGFINLYAVAIKKDNKDYVILKSDSQWTKDGIEVASMPVFQSKISAYLEKGVGIDDRELSLRAKSYANIYNIIIILLSLLALVSLVLMFIHLKKRISKLSRC